MRRSRTQPSTWGSTLIAVIAAGGLLLYAARTLRRAVTHTARPAATSSAAPAGS